MGVAVHLAATGRGDAGTLGVDDAIVVGESRGFGLGREFGGTGNVDVPRMMQVEVGYAPGHQLRVGKAVAGILLGVPGDVQGRTNGIPDRVRAGIGRAGIPLAISNVDSDAETPVVGELDSLEFPLAHGNDQAAAVACGHLGRRGTLTFRLLQYPRRQIL